MTLARASRRRRKRAVVVALTATSLLIGGAGAAMGQDSSTDVEASPSPTPLPDEDAKTLKTYRLRARVKPAPTADFSAPKTLPDAMGGVRQGACQQTHNVIWDGEPKVSRVKVRMIRQQGEPENAWAPTPSGACAATEQQKSGYKIRIKVSYPTPSGDRVITGKLKLAKAFSVLAERMNAMRERVLQTGNEATFKLKLIRVKKKVPGMISGLARRYTLSVTKSLSIAKCESGFDPKAYNPAGPWAGVYQQDTDYWPSRAKKFGHPGEGVFNAYANVDVSLKMARSMGWSHWACA